jgi:hypothetical protein
MRLLWTSALFLLGCTGGIDQSTDPNPDTDSAGETDSETDVDLNPDDYHGVVPETAKELLASFSAQNSDDTSRGPEDLTGQPTVLWFFPFAGTPG